MDGGWSQWSSWTHWSSSYTTYSRTFVGNYFYTTSHTVTESADIRDRTCTNPSPAYGGRNCPGISHDAKNRHHSKWSILLYIFRSIYIETPLLTEKYRLFYSYYMPINTIFLFCIRIIFYQQTTLTCPKTYSYRMINLIIGSVTFRS